MPSGMTAPAHGVGKLKQIKTPLREVFIVQTEAGLSSIDESCRADEMSKMCEIDIRQMDGKGRV